MEGGGSTIRGIPEKDSVKPFVSTQFNGKKGTYVLMLGGSVRFVSDKISDEVLKRLAAIKGGGPPVNLDQEAPLVNPDDVQREMSATKPGG